MKKYNQLVAGALLALILFCSGSEADAKFLIFGKKKDKNEKYQQRLEVYHQLTNKAS
jgi:hypothetical protein